MGPPNRNRSSGAADVDARFIYANAVDYVAGAYRNEPVFKTWANTTRRLKNGTTESQYSIWSE